MTNATTRGLRVPGPPITLVSATGFPLDSDPLNGGSNSNANGNINNVPAAPSGGINPVAVALPIVFGVLALCFMGFCVWFKRKHPDFGRGFFTFRRRQRWAGGGDGGGRGYGIGRSKSQRLRGQDIKVVTTDINGLRMNAMAMNGDRGGSNVFREEMRRQDRARF